MSSAGDSRPSWIGRYLVLRELGRGGMGTVVEAFDHTLDRHVAIKLLHRTLDEQHTQRLLREARALAKLSHPHVVQVYEVGELDGRAFIVMELVRGRTLREWIRREPRPRWRECVRVFLQVGEGLAAAHARDLVHRDFKPGNAILDEEGRARVLDFGLARLADGGEPGDEQLATTPEGLDAAADESMASLTRTGAVLGTPGYMPPEQMLGVEADARSDQFSFCVSLYEALYGERPYEGNTMAALMLSMRAGRVRPPPKGREVPGRLRQAVLQGLALEPEARWASMDELLACLRRQVGPRSWRWLGVAVGAAVGLTGLGLGLAYQAQVGRRCAGARAELSGIWDDARRDELRTAVLGTELPYAADTLTRVEARLDAYAEDWVASKTRVCEATRVTQEQAEEVMSLRMGCLSTRRIAMETAVTVLLRAEPSRMSRAIDLVDALPGLRRCDDVEALRAEVEPPEDPVVAEAVAEQRTRLAESKALFVLGDYAGSERIASEAVERAEALQHAPLVAEALARRGDALDSLGELDRAERDLERAFLLGLEHQHLPVLRQAALVLTFVVGYERAQLDAGHRWGEITLALSRHPDADPVERAKALRVVGHVLHTEGKLEPALEHYRQALEIFEGAEGPRARQIAATLDDIGIVAYEQGKYAEAEAQYRRALTLYEEALGPHHPDLGNTLNNIGDVLRKRGDREQARACFERAIALWSRTLGPDHPQVALAVGNLGLVYMEEGDYEQALASYRRALELQRRAFGPEHTLVASLLADTGKVLYRMGRLDEARAELDRALELQQRARGPRHPKVAFILVYLGQLLVDQGKLEEALDAYQRALDIRRESLDADHPLISETQAVVADTLRRLGRPVPAADEPGAAEPREAIEPGPGGDPGSATQAAGQ